MTVQGRRLFLCHGDQINRPTMAIVCCACSLHNRLAAAAVTHVPPSLALRIKERLQRASRAGYQIKIAALGLPGDHPLLCPIRPGTGM